MNVALRGRAFGAAPVIVFAANPVAGAANTVGGPGSGPALVPTGVYISALVSPGAKFYRLKTGVRPDGSADANQVVST
jgi:hypothetical protein